MPQTYTKLLRGYQGFNVFLPRRPPTPQGLVDVDLCGNQITLEGLRALCEGVAVCPTLAAVTLDSNDLREEGGRVREDREGWVLDVGEHGAGIRALACCADVVGSATKDISPACVGALCSLCNALAVQDTRLAPMRHLLKSRRSCLRPWTRTRG